MQENKQMPTQTIASLAQRIATDSSDVRGAESPLLCMQCMYNYKNKSHRFDYSTLPNATVITLTLARAVRPAHTRLDIRKQQMRHIALTYNRKIEMTLFFSISIFSVFSFFFFFPPSSSFHTSLGNRTSSSLRVASLAGSLLSLKNIVNSENHPI